MESGNYKTISSLSKGSYKEKGSRFLAYAYPVSNQEEIRQILETLRRDFHDARHHCYAYVIGHDRSQWRVNDDGEPSGTAGRPILGQINSAELTNILIVVIRYFGGTLLGVSGLINAYKTAAADAIENAVKEERFLHAYYEIRFSYETLNDVMKILKEENAGQAEQKFDLDCNMIVDFKVSSADRILGRIGRIKGLEFRFIEEK
jgi:uncharacterized YigZ family protein